MRPLNIRLLEATERLHVAAKRLDHAGGHSGQPWAIAKYIAARGSLERAAKVFARLSAQAEGRAERAALALEAAQALEEKNT